MWHTVRVCHKKERVSRAIAELSFDKKIGSIISNSQHFQNGCQRLLNYPHFFKGQIYDGLTAKYLMTYPDCVSKSVLVMSKAQSHHYLPNYFEYLRDILGVNL